ncbi:DDB1- and CUL4-associated factor 5 [Diorhabda carinulata]|uniref:DDB1- and CUL4-associated factor 5 n=1 Tax=Diorhabda carinulata TaxID=1163345 RepID=UPI0025A09923|nr:DDB1- and CUL4-associated factor 5 [Diorhabda carinulata]
MAMPSINPVNYIIERQYKDNIFIKNKLVSARLSKARNLYRKDLLAHYGCVNAIEFSVDGEYLVSGGDDKRVLLWYVPGAIYDQGSPVVMTAPHRSNIFCLTFDSCNEKIFSGGNDDQVLIHQIESRSLTTSIPHDKPVYGVSIHPQNDNIISTAGEDGRILLFDIREVPNQEVQVVAQENSGFHSVMFNPMKPRYLVTANSEEGIGLWDCRKPKNQLIRYDTQSGKTSGISACFDSTGKKVLALRRRLPPVLYLAENENAVCQFYHPQYYNSCTMKTCCFAGSNDEYILSGSDDFNLYMWKIPMDESEWGSSHMVLRGHRSIVNQVRYNSHNNFIASSGVEKMIKLWSPVPVGNWRGSILKEHTEPVRKIYTHDDYMSLVGNTDRINHDYSDQSTCEDSKMMAFFDSLIQREIEGWDSQTDGTFSTDSDSEEEDWSKLISKIFKNGRCNSDEPKKYRSNRITQLISKKKNTLAKLAHSKSSSYRKKYHQKVHKRKSTKSKYGKHNGFHKKSHKKCPERDCSMPSRKHKKSNGRPSKYFTRSVKNMTDNDSTENSLDTPSTSTGITSSERSIFRLIEQDSDDDARNMNEIDGNEELEANNLVNILPTPLNGSRDSLINILEVANGNTSSRTLRSSTSAARLTLNEDPRRVQMNGANSLTGSPDNPDQGFSETSDSDFEYASTPAKRRLVSVSDSGCGTGPSSSSSIGSSKTAHRLQPHCSNDERSPDSERCRKKCRYTMRKAKRVKKKIGVDSDEN